MLLRAFAKINLDLRILGRRDDGFHEIRTILQTIDWADEIVLDHAPSFVFSATSGPEDETNLVVRAVRAFERMTGTSANVHIRLRKNVPIGRGLGGGSADAAVTLVGLQRLFRMTLPIEAVLVALRGLGSDVPFFSVGGRALGTGRGDRVEALADGLEYWLVVVDPGISIPTAAAYSWLTPKAKSNSIEGLCADLIPGQEEARARNHFESAVFERHPELLEIKDDLLRLGAFHAALSGSGSAIFGQFRSESEAVRSAAKLDSQFSIKVTKPLPRSEYFHRMVDDQVGQFDQ